MQRSAVSRTWANPDGSFTSEGFSGPSWTRDAAGEWVAIDATLVADATGVRPRAAAVQVDLSPGTAGQNKPKGDAWLLGFHMGADRFGTTGLPAGVSSQGPRPAWLTPIEFERNRVITVA